MNDTYTHQQAMVILRLRSHNALYQLKRKYPDAFVVVSQGTGKTPVTLYEKESLDKFAAIRGALKQQGEP